jgi:hypothetical protein
MWYRLSYLDVVNPTDFDLEPAKPTQLAAGHPMHAQAAHITNNLLSRGEHGHAMATPDGFVVKLYREVSPVIRQKITQAAHPHRVTIAR